MNYYMVSIGDFNSLMHGADLVSEGIFYRLVSRYMHSEKPIETQWVIFAFPEETQKRVFSVLNAVFIKDGETWRLPILDDQIEKYHAKALKNKANGSKGGRPKKTDSVNYGNPEKPSGFFPETQTKAKKTLKDKRLKIKDIDKEISKENKPDLNLDPRATISNEANPEPNETDKGDKLPCPYERIKQVFNESLPELPAITRMSDGRKKALRARWIEETTRLGITTQDAGIAHFKAFFERVKRSDFLAGRKTDWRADFDWLIKAANFLKTLEGKYDNSSNHSNSNQHGPDCENDSYDFSEFGRVS